MALNSGVNLGDPRVFSPAGSFATFGDVVNVVVRNAFVLAGLISFVLLILGGFGVIVAAGDAKKLEAARGRIVGAVIGLILIIGSFWIVQILGIITGRNLLSPPGV